MSPQDPQIAPEFSHPFRVDKIKPGGSHEKGKANAEQRENLARRLGVNGLDNLTFSCDLLPWKKGGAAVKCQIKAKIRQTCVVTLDEFDSDLDLFVSRYFAHSASHTGPDTVLDLEALDDDIPDPIVDGKIDLGELAVQELALSIDLHPRKPGAVFCDHLEPVSGEKNPGGRPNPFEALKVLKGGSGPE